MLRDTPPAPTAHSLPTKKQSEQVQALGIDHTSYAAVLGRYVPLCCVVIEDEMLTMSINKGPLVNDLLDLWAF